MATHIHLKSEVNFCPNLPPLLSLPCTLSELSLIILNPFKLQLVIENIVFCKDQLAKEVSDFQSNIFLG